NQPEFVNCVSSIETTLSAHSLLEALQKIEHQLGRQRDPENQNAPRLIDLDVLLFGNEVVNDDTLVVPHPRLEQRLFTLEPLCEIAPKLSWNEFGNVTEILKQGYATGRFVDQIIQRLT
ncbi:UNVERIFIED_CONTAM: hypothetical protein GTU68_006242, partial [Idotea baltica]|nr:hypothetical protein [Idotea baltica]